MTRVEQIEQRLEHLSDQRLAYQRAWKNADTDESGQWFLDQIRRIDAESSRLIEQRDRLIAARADNLMGESEQTD